MKQTAKSIKYIYSCSHCTVITHLESKFWQRLRNPESRSKGRIVQWTQILTNCVSSLCSKKRQRLGELVIKSFEAWAVCTGKHAAFLSLILFLEVNLPRHEVHYVHHHGNQYKFLLKFYHVQSNVSRPWGCKTYKLQILLFSASNLNEKLTLLWYKKKILWDPQRNNGGHFTCCRNQSDWLLNFLMSSYEVFTFIFFILFPAFL